MMERPMWDAGSGEHPDEGTIHAWLDGALDELSAERVEKHVRSCAACSALTAEARGLIAGASRIVSALDDVPAGTRPAWAQSEVAEPDAVPAASSRAAAEANRSLWRRLRVTPARAAIAATIILAVGVTLTHDRIADESAVQTSFPAGHSEPRSGGMTERVAVAPEAPPKDAALDSAVARNLSIAQGKPSIEASRQPAIPQAPPPGTAPVEIGPVALAEKQVAEGRAATMAMRDTAGVAADKVRVGSAAGAAAPGDLLVRTPARKESGNAASPATAGAAAPVAQGYADAGARTCYSLESTQSGAMWGDQPLPLTVVVDSGSAVGMRRATVRSAALGTEVRAAWVRSGKDSVFISLQRVGLTGTIALGPDVGGRAGTASSSAIVATTRMEEVVRPDADTRARAKAAAPSAAPKPEATVVPGMSARRAPSAAPLPVTLRSIACPTR